MCRRFSHPFSFLSTPAPHPQITPHNPHTHTKPAKKTAHAACLKAVLAFTGRFDLFAAIFGGPAASEPVRARLLRAPHMQHYIAACVAAVRLASASAGVGGLALAAMMGVPAAMLSLASVPGCGGAGFNPAATGGALGGGAVLPPPLPQPPRSAALQEKQQQQQHQQAPIDPYTDLYRQWWVFSFFFGGGGGKAVLNSVRKPLPLNLLLSIIFHTLS